MRIIIFLFFLLVSSSYAADIIDNPELLYQMPTKESGILEQKVTLNWRFNSFNDFVSTLQKNYSLNSKILSTAAIMVSPVSTYGVNISLEQLINQVSAKFGYTWIYKKDILMFKAINPEINVKSIANKSELKWELVPGDKTLRTGLSKWCQRANWQLVWNVRADYPITTAWFIAGSFESAVNEVLKASQSTDMPLLAIMHDSNRVLEITSLAATYKY